ncbi:hypothetical protein LguiB_025630 [Lonicera macranthoides]
MNRMVMARSVSSTKVLATSFLDRISISLTRRGYAATAGQGAASAGVEIGGSTGHRVGKVEENPVIKQDTTKPSSSWGPDPVTGFYKPSDQAAEVDAADLREIHKTKNH